MPEAVYGLKGSLPPRLGGSFAECPHPRCLGRGFFYDECIHVECPTCLEPIVDDNGRIASWMGFGRIELPVEPEMLSREYLEDFTNGEWPQ